MCSWRQPPTEVPGKNETTELALASRRASIISQDCHNEQQRSEEETQINKKKKTYIKQGHKTKITENKIKNNKQK